MGVLLLGLCAFTPLAAEAQGLDCADLRARINATPVTPPSARSIQLTDDANKLHDEIRQMRGYMDSIGCNRTQFLFFGSGRPAQCDGLKARVSQMEANEAQMRRSAAMGEGGPRAELMARYRMDCQNAEAAPRPARSLLEDLFGGGQQPPPQDVPINPDVPLGDQTVAKGGNQPICVRLADGGFFPVDFAQRGRDYAGLSELCQALCPGTETRLFHWNPNGDLNNAVDLNGNVYSALPNAHKFETKYIAEASCLPAGKTWAEVLGPAEELLGRRARGDMLVTEEQAAVMSRARAPTPPVPAKGKKKKNGAEAPDPMDAYTASLAAATSGPAVSAGISNGTPVSGPLIPLDGGETREVVGPDGVKHKIRIIAPTL